jgi:predicted nucleic acid binding AN1-type Zn finger protein
LASNLNYLITKTITHDDKTTSKNRSFIKKSNANSCSNCLIFYCVRKVVAEETNVKKRNQPETEIYLKRITTKLLLKNQRWKGCQRKKYNELTL